MTDDVQAHRQQAGNGNVLKERVRRLESDQAADETAIKELAERIDKLTLAVVGFALTLAVFGLGIAVTLLTSR